MDKSEIQDILSRQPNNLSLIGEFYSNENIFTMEMPNIIFNHWICVGHESKLENIGDWFKYDISTESIIIIRGKDNEVRAMHNVCRHRGSRICREKKGNSNILTCPYHAWSFDSKGNLISSNNTSPNLDKEQWGLHKVHLQIINGLILICLGDKPPSLENAKSSIKEGLGPYGWEKAKIAHTKTYSFNANWKLAVDNYQECLHCNSVHKEFSRSHAIVRPDSEVVEIRKQAKDKIENMGISIPTVLNWPHALSENEEMVACFHDALFEGYQTGSKDGLPVAPLMGDFKSHDGGVTYFDIGPISFFLAYPDHGVLFSFVPQSIDKTDLEISWLVSNSAIDGQDYDLNHLTWLWDSTTIEDKDVVEGAQKGVISRFYQPGPYGPMETAVESLKDWYLKHIKDLL
jgi:phenylpropionate dioxygenase-like ring-hydroxylating dioxygenase large terminal subunit